MTPVLLIGYGNTLRRDDGAGPAIVETLADQSGVKTYVVHQLTPELADELAVCRRVVFVDAAVAVQRVEVRKLKPASQSLNLGHTGDPEQLLALTIALHGHCPEAWLVSVPAADLSHGEGFSPETHSAIEAAISCVRELCDLPHYED